MRTCLQKQFCSAPLCQSLGKGLAFAVLGDAEREGWGLGRRMVEQRRRRMTVVQDNRTCCGQLIVDPGHVSPVPLTRGSERSLPVTLKVNDRTVSYPKRPSTGFKSPSLLSFPFCSIESLRAVTDGGSTRCQGFICIISLSPYKHPGQGHCNPIFILFCTKYFKHTEKYSAALSKSVATSCMWLFKFTLIIVK